MERWRHNLIERGDPITLFLTFLAAAAFVLVISSLLAP
jgi:hypothetical protein